MIYVADELQEIDDELSMVIGSAWSKSTLACRNSQWSRFIKFCHQHGLQPLPASANTVARFLVWQSRSSKFSTCNNYLSAINTLHKFYGCDIDFRQVFLVKLVLKGLKSTLGNTTIQKIPFSVEELMAMYRSLDFNSELEMLCWTVIIVSFRTLLRKSNLVPSTTGDYSHVLRRRDIQFHDWGMTVKVSSTKTLRFSEYTLDIPVHFVANKALCAASAVKYHLQSVIAEPDSPLFVCQGKGSLEPLLYSAVLSHIKVCASRIGLDPLKVGCHSLRRSGAAHMHSIGIPLVDIMSIGDWRSMAVLEYLVTPMDRKEKIQRTVAASLS